MRAHISSQWDRITFYGKPPKAREPGPEPTPDIPPLPKVFDDEPEFVLEGNDWGGWGKLTEDGFKVYAGSFAHDCTPSFKAKSQYYPIRRRLEDEGVIVDGFFVKDFTFRSAAQAGCVLASAHIQATRLWHTVPDADGEVLTYEDCHPRAKGVLAREKRQRAAERARRAAERLGEAAKRLTKSLLQGRGWKVEWRGYFQPRKNGFYSAEIPRFA